MVFKRADARGKCFIEYIPAEKAWIPIVADGYMHIDCFWVSGQFKGQENADLLLNKCIKDAKEKGKKWLTVLSSSKKKPFLSDPNFLKYKGFEVADTALTFYELLYLPFDKNEQKPHFKANVKDPKIIEQGFVLYYSSQCPYIAKYVPIIENIAKESDVPFISVHLDSTEQAQNAPPPFTA